MSGLIVFSIVLLILGTLLTVRLWPRRKEEGVGRALWVIWTLIVLIILAALVFTYTNTALFAWWIWKRLTIGIERAGLPLLMARAVASLLILPVLFTIYLVVASAQWKRYMGIGIFSGMAFCFFLLQYIYRDQRLPFTVGGESTIGYTISVRHNRVSTCDTPGATDQASGLPCLPMIPEVKAYLDETKTENKPLKVENPTEFFRMVDGKPKLWVCRPAPEEYYFVVIPMSDPLSGLTCESVTREFVREHQARLRQKTEWEKEQKLQQEERERERQKIEEKIKEKVAEIQQKAEDPSVQVKKRKTDRERSRTNRKIKFDIPRTVQYEYPDLIPLILETESMDNEDRQYWFQILPVMTDEQVRQLRSILNTEKQELRKLRKKKQSDEDEDNEENSE